MEVNYIQTFILSAFSFAFFSSKLLAIFQQCGYKTDEFFRSLFKNNLKQVARLSAYSLVFTSLLAFCGLIFQKNEDLRLVLVIAVAVFFNALFFFTESLIKRADFTNRFIRIFTVSFLAVGFITAWLYRVAVSFLPKDLYGFCFLIIGLVPIFSPIAICIGKIINLPYDWVRYTLSVKKCTKKLRRASDVIKIGITGSCGKTSVKNYLYEMLSTKYRVLKTPSSYNTPLGICKTVNGSDLDVDIFIAEMGARRKNDIKKLCKTVRPSMGIITGITDQHGETLGGIEGIKRAKNQLIGGLVGEKTAIFSSDTKESEELFKKANCKKYLVGIKGKRFVYAKNIKQEKHGIYFTLVISGKEYQTFSPLLGEHNISNICLAVCASKILGVEDEKILSVIPRLSPPPHRAQILQTDEGITVIDDGYNANIVGLRSTAKAVQSFDGEKIAVTPGIVELGKNSKEINFEVGKILGETFDEVIAVGKNADDILSGYSAVKRKDNAYKNFGKKVNTREKAQEILATKNLKGKVVVFFNDLPDRY